MAINKLWTSDEVAAHLNVTVRQVQNYVKNKNLVGRLIGGVYLIDQASVLNFVRPEMGRPKKPRIEVRPAKKGRAK